MQLNGAFVENDKRQEIQVQWGLFHTYQVTWHTLFSQDSINLLWNNPGILASEILETITNICFFSIEKVLTWAAMCFLEALYYPDWKKYILTCLRGHCWWTASGRLIYWISSGGLICSCSRCFPGATHLWFDPQTVKTLWYMKTGKSGPKYAIPLVGKKKKKAAAAFLLTLHKKKEQF